ncbi:hypothetical protein JTE90_023933 [Oedothorax gibbosus]|uniref:Uncharacterized protein n=1 Tax=Oedothorax gibbosus TaxID=931172 RepID=A0AAV6UU75_9ARAC|nr:hypothetical protein JTE90_023933 [Oedothorax gibbosus]
MAPFIPPFSSKGDATCINPHPLPSSQDPHPGERENRSFIQPLKSATAHRVAQTDRSSFGDVEEMAKCSLLPVPSSLVSN